MENKFSQDYTTGPDMQLDIDNNKLMVQLNGMKESISDFIQEANKRLESLESQQKSGSDILTDYERQIQELKDHISRMESGLQLDFKTTQDILRARLEHEMNIERARLDFEQKLKEKEAELKQQQKKIMLDNEQKRQQIRNDLLLKLGGIGLPIVAAAAGFIAKWLDKW